MKSQSAYMEIRRRGSLNDFFEKYDVVFHHTELFVTNHWHNETEIIYVTCGSITITINNKTFVGKPGDIFLVNSGEMHEIYSNGIPVEYTAFVFDFDILSFRKNDFAQQNFMEPIHKGEICFRNHIQTSEKALAILQHLNDINTQKNECYMLCTKALLVQFFALLIEEEQTISAREFAPDNEKKQLLKSIVAYINENYTQKILLTDIAEQFHMSHKYFCRFFKKNFGKTLVEYINDVRIEHSISLLDQKNLSVTEIAIACGFCNMSYFAHTFKKKMGCTPSEYQKRDSSI